MSCVSTNACRRYPCMPVSSIYEIFLFKNVEINTVKTNNGMNEWIIMIQHWKKNTKLGKNQRQRQQNELIISTLKETKQKKLVRQRKTTIQLNLSRRRRKKKFHRIFSSCVVIRSLNPNTDYWWSWEMILKSFIYSDYINENVYVCIVGNVVENVNFRQNQNPDLSE